VFLTPEELESLTHRVRPSAQICALRRMGIESRQRPDGSVVVLRSAVEIAMGGVVPGRIAKSRVEPNWKALDDLRQRPKRAPK
jgi:hypothetical protein